MKEALLEAAHITGDVMKVPEPGVLFISFGDSSLNFELLRWISNPLKQFFVKSELHFSIVEQFKKKQITIPFPQRDVHIRHVPDRGLFY